MKKIVASFLKSSILSAAFLLCAVLPFFISPAYADGCLDDDYGILVKTSFNTTFYVADDYCGIAPLGYTEIWLLLEGFTDESGGITMADPGAEPAHTYNPYSFVRFGDVNGDGWTDATFHFETFSLRDVGIYYHTLTGNTTDGYYIYPLLVNSFASEVINGPPSAAPEIVGSPQVGSTYDLRANSQDNDPGLGSETSSLSHHWQIISPATHSGSIAHPSDRNTTIHFVDEDDIGDWHLRVQVDDNEGQRITRDVHFHVDELPPEVNILGERDIDVLTDIDVYASTDVDRDGGPPLNFQWEIISAPATNSVDLTTIPLNNRHLIIPTTGPECGEWQFRLTTSDNEHEEDDVDTVTVTVHNIFPTISVPGDESIVVGDHIHFEVSPEDDPDGGMLDITWDLIQSPDAGGYAPGPDFDTGAILDIHTNSDCAGTWIFEVHVYDDEEFERGEFHHRVQVLVDAEPVADVTTAASIVSLLDPLVLDASGSVDPDTDNPHTNTEGAPVLSGGISYYNWWIIELPADAYGEYFPGPVDEVIGASNGAATLGISPGMLSTGHWTFEVEVTDAEGNTDSAAIFIEIIDPDSVPAAFIFPAAATYYTDIDGNLSQDIVLNGCLSFDPDNLLHEAYSPGLGIDYYRWSVLTGPRGCTITPTLSEGAGACSSTLFPAASVLLADCQGLWMPALEVRDDESHLGYSAAFIFIGNCSDRLCIDYPKSPETGTYAYVEFTDETDIIIYYHLDSLLYANPDFNAGMRLELSIFHEDDLVLPAYSAHYDYDPLPTDRGGFLTLHWHGYTNAGDRPRPGKYTIKLKATSPTGVLPVYETVEPESIWIEVVDVEIVDSSDELLSINSAKNGTDVLNIYYETSTYFTAGEIFDAARLIIKPEGSDTAVYEAAILDPLSGAATWNGALAPDIYLSPGSYTAEVEVFKEGHCLGVSSAHRFVAYELDCALDGVADEDEEVPGAWVNVGDTINATITLTPSDGSVSGDVYLNLLSGASVVEISDGGTPVPTDGSAIFTEADFSVPKVLAINVVDSTDSPAEVEVRFDPVDGEPEQTAVDIVVINALEVDLAADTNNDGRITDLDESVEDSSPGLVRWINANDNNGNGTLDLNDPGPVVGEEDLAEVELHFQAGSTSGTLTLAAPVGGAYIRVWSDAIKTTPISLPVNYTVGSDTIPDRVYIEGFDEGETHLKLEFRDDSSVLLMEDELYITVIAIDLDVDTNRDLAVDVADETGEDAWTGSLGATGHVNNDNDDHLAGNTEIDNQNAVIDGATDENDMAPLVIRRARIGALPGGWRVVLSVPWHHERLRIFDESDTAVIGPGLTGEYEIPNITTSDLNYLVEFLDYPAAVQVPPEFTLRLTLYDATGEVYTDNTRIHVAPFILTNNLDPANEMFVVRLSGDPDSATFVTALDTIAGLIGVPLTPIDGALYGNDPWIQDEIEFGYTVTPTNEMDVVLDSPRNRGLDDFPEAEILSDDFGYYTTGSASSTYDCFGNLDCTPPVTVGGTRYPLGRILYGENTPAGTGVDAAVQEFLHMQEVQSPIIINTGWLRVGHVDEMISFVPYPGAGPTDKNFKMLVASPQDALTILEAEPDHSVVIPQLGESIADIITHDAAFNVDCQVEIDDVMADLIPELNLDPADIIEIPVLFREHGSTGQANALLPNIVNLISVNGHLIVAEPFFDPFKDAFNTRLQAVGFVPPGSPGQNIHYIDDWEVYHLGHGEIHCGTNVERDSAATDNWWDVY